MNNGILSRKLLLGCGLAGVALAAMLTMGETPTGSTPSAASDTPALAEQGAMPPGYQRIAQPGSPQAAPVQQGSPRSGEAQQALEGLTQIRQQQCQSGNHLACQALPQMPGYGQKLAQLDQACRSNDPNACAEHEKLAQRIFTAYAESAAVMRAGEAGMAQMNAWRAQMNANAAASMSNLQAQAAAGQAAHEARQEANAAMNKSWEAGQASIDRGHGRYVDSIYGGTTMDGGGVQARVPYGTQGYTDGYGNVIAVPNGGQAPDGYEAMNPTYAAPY